MDEGAKEKGQKAALFCPICGSPLETLVFVKRDRHGLLKPSFYFSSYCPKCDVIRQYRSFKRCRNCGGNIIGIRVTQPGEEFCWLCGGDNLGYLTSQEEKSLREQIKLGNEIAAWMERALDPIKKIERCLDGGNHRFYLGQTRHLENVFYEIVCAKCGERFRAYSLTLGSEGS
jgi:hypothetical protein